MTSVKLSRCTKECQSAIGSMKRKRGAFIMQDELVKKNVWVQIHTIVQKMLWLNSIMKPELFLLDFVDVEIEKKYWKLILRNLLH